MPNKTKNSTKKFNKMREAIIQSFLACLKENEIPWHREWSVSQIPLNATTGTLYKGVNHLWLSYIQEIKGYNDPRWCTFNQANAKGWSIKAGEKGTKIEFWSLYDREEKEKISAEEAARRGSELGRDEYLERFRPISSVYTVFNGEQIEGIEPYKAEVHELNQSDLMRVKNTLITNMELHYEEKGDQAYYSPAQDKVVLPEMEKFQNEYAYISTLLHECGHATGAAHRLNRQLQNDFGTPGYAREELRAEIASAFTAQVTGIQFIQDEHMENHKAYIQNWIHVLENNPNELFAAIKEAEKISDYLIEKGEFFKEREAVFELEVGNAYLYVKEAESGYDYTFYNAGFMSLKQGVVEDVYDLETAAQKAMEDNQFGDLEIYKTDTDKFLEQVDEIRRDKMYKEVINHIKKEEIEDLVLNYVKEQLKNTEYDVNITDVKQYHIKGMEDSSGIHVLLQYEGELPEAAMSDLLNSEKFQIAQIDVNIKPVLKDESITIEEIIQKLEQGTDKPVSRYQKFVQEHKNKINSLKTEKEVIVINAFAGPGAGKTVSCMDICSELKKRGYNAEYVQEYAKELVYDKNYELLDGSEANQFKILKEQLHRMDRLYEETDFIVTDSPILLNAIYNNEPSKEYLDMIDELYTHYNNFSYFVQRDASHFQKEGRIHNLQESQQKDEEIKSMLSDHGIYYGTYPHNRIMKVADNSIVTYNRINQEKIKSDKQKGTPDNLQNISADTAKKLFLEEIDVYTKKDQNTIKIENQDDIQQDSNYMASQQDVKAFSEYQEKIHMVKELEDNLELPQELRITTKEGECISRELLNEKYEEMMKEKQHKPALTRTDRERQIKKQKQTETARIKKRPVLEL